MACRIVILLSKYARHGDTACSLYHGQYQRWAREPGSDDSNFGDRTHQLGEVRHLHLLPDSWKHPGEPHAGG